MQKSIQCYLGRGAHAPKSGTRVIVEAWEWISFPVSDYCKTGVKFSAIVTSKASEMEFDCEDGRNGFRGRGFMAQPKTRSVPATVHYFAYNRKLSKRKAK